MSSMGNSGHYSKFWISSWALLPEIPSDPRPQCHNLAFLRLSEMEMGADGNSEGALLVRLQSLGVSDTRGKHRVEAELKRLEQETRSLEVSLVLDYSFSIDFWSLRWLLVSLLMIIMLFFSLQFGVLIGETLSWSGLRFVWCSDLINGEGCRWGSWFNPPPLSLVLCVIANKMITWYDYGFKSER